MDKKKKVIQSKPPLSKAEQLERYEILTDLQQHIPLISYMTEIINNN
jgi:hypothetical protein